MKNNAAKYTNHLKIIPCCASKFRNFMLSSERNKSTINNITILNIATLKFFASNPKSNKELSVNIHGFHSRTMFHNIFIPSLAVGALKNTHAIHTRQKVTNC